MTKCCNKCKETKPYTEFYKDSNKKDGVATYCKVCKDIKARRYYQNNKDKVQAYKKEWVNKNKDVVAKYRQKYQETNKEMLVGYRKDYYAANKEDIKARATKWQSENKEHRAQYHKEYREKNKEKLRLQKKRYQQNNKEAISIKKANYQKVNRKKINEYRKAYNKNREKVDEIFKFKARVRSCIFGAFYRKGFTKRSKTAKLLGCTFEELNKHLIYTFEVNYNLGWKEEYRKKLHIDHIIPLNIATTEDEVKQLNHYTNLQYLWAKDNMTKGSNYKEQTP